MLINVDLSKNGGSQHSLLCNLPFLSLIVCLNISKNADLCLFQAGIYADHVVVVF